MKFTILIDNYAFVITDVSIDWGEDHLRRPYWWVDSYNVSVLNASAEQERVLNDYEAIIEREVRNKCKTMLDLEQQEAVDCATWKQHEDLQDMKQGVI